MESLEYKMHELEVKLIDSMGSDDSPAFSAWVSTARDRDRSEEDISSLIERLSRDGHLGCFEHQAATFEIHCPIFVARQIQRHRTFSYNELSGRYKDFREQPVYLPKDMEESGVARDAVQSAITSYAKLRELGYSRENARIILPLGTMTRFRMTGNLRNWSHFLSLRMSEHAQDETRLMAELIYNRLQSLWPVIVSNLRKNW